ncbi:condensation domain-containing protein [Streptomyces sp. NPDC001401]|uniref:condensation domain-containing protein n=1 Tax=Streptomyces sp. NPDC001401 TaxID=3364570 RepID=UPI0036834F6B
MQKTASHLVSFSGCTSGTHDLAWAQIAAVRSIERIGTALTPPHVRKDGPLTGVRRVGDVLSAIRKVLERHQALRSHWERAEDGRLVQVVRAEGALSVDQYEVAADAVSSAAHEIKERLALEDFKSDELPVRVALLTVHGAPAAIAMLLHHVFADGIASAIVYEEIVNLSLGRALPGPSGWQPGEIAAFERSARGRAQAERADVFLRKQLRAASVPTPPRVDPTGGEPTFVWARLQSQAAAPSVASLSRRYGVSAANVIFAAYAAVLGQWTRQTSITLRLTVANRAHPGTRYAVTNLFQAIPLSVPAQSGTFGELVRDVSVVAFQGYRCSWYDHDRFVESRSLISAERGHHVALPFGVNLRVIGQSDFNGTQSLAEKRTFNALADLGPDALRKLSTASQLTEDRLPAALPDLNVRFSVWALAETAVMTLMGDTSAIPIHGPRLLLSGLDSILLDAALASGDTPLHQLSQTVLDRAADGRTTHEAS